MQGTVKAFCWTAWQIRCKTSSGRLVSLSFCKCIMWARVAFVGVVWMYAWFTKFISCAYTNWHIVYTYAFAAKSEIVGRIKHMMAVLLSWMARWDPLLQQIASSGTCRHVVFLDPRDPQSMEAVSRDCMRADMLFYMLSSKACFHEAPWTLSKFVPNHVAAAAFKKDGHGT